MEKIDDYLVVAETPRGQREFQLDRVFGAEASQNDLFHDTNRLDGSCFLIMDQYSIFTNILYCRTGPRCILFVPP